MPYSALKPEPDNQKRSDESRKRRKAAASVITRPGINTTSNGEATKFEGNWATSFTKGLPHDVFGNVNRSAFESFFHAINAKGQEKFEVPLGPAQAIKNFRPHGWDEEGDSVQYFLTDKSKQVRSWESPRAGHVYDLEGPDAGAVGMAPAPKLGSDELAAEMAENYAMALLRDNTFEEIRNSSATVVTDIVDALNSMAWFQPGAEVSDPDLGDSGIDPVAQRRLAARLRDGATKLEGHSLFRGSSPGCMKGPYISQFLLRGNAAKGIADASETRRSKGYIQTRQMSHQINIDGNLTSRPNKAEDGYVAYGAQLIDQRVQVHKEGLDYMTDWASWLDVQNGADLRGKDAYEKDLKFITTPRDLATFVHFDALYQAYLNACLFLLSIEADADQGFPEGGLHKTRSAFATFGGPHILTLVTETATRSLKAVRRQKYCHHLRARPEALGAVATLAASGSKPQLSSAEPDAVNHLNKLRQAKSGRFDLMGKVNEHNKKMPKPELNGHAESYELPEIEGANYLLPMAFPEGSPMHPAYGAGHATVAGSCVTVLKAFFQLFKTDENDTVTWDPLPLSHVGGAPDERPIKEVFVPDANGLKLVESQVDSPDDLTLIGELNKLAANISIGRNMAGVHYYSDYFDSLRMGERIAIGLLQEQLVTYPEPVTMRLTSFDNERLTLETDGSGKVATLTVTDQSDVAIDTESWWGSFVPPSASS